MQKTGLNAYVYDFSVDCDAITVDDILDIHKYLMEKNGILIKIKNTNLKVFNLMSRTNETRYIKLHKTCKCKCRLDASICNNKQRWNDDKFRCECKRIN